MEISPPHLPQQFFEMLVESQRWSPEALVSHQRNQLGKLLIHAKKTVPFYEHRLDAVIGSDGNIDWDNWHEIPVVKRQDLHDARDAMQSQELPAGHGPIGTSSSSGSTGLPVVITANGISRSMWRALRWRVQKRLGFDWSRRMLSRMGDIEGPVDWPRGTPKGPWGPPWDAGAQKGFWWSLNSKVPNAAILDFLDKRPCEYLVAGPKTAHLLALESIRSNRPLHLEKIVVQSGKLGDDDRAICEKVFGAQVMEVYSSKEGGQIAHPCARGRLHINTEAVLVEVLGPDDRPVLPGAVGRVVITPLYSTAQPLIRYDQGDLARVGEGCDCGLTLPVLDEVVGRTLAVFQHPDGRTAVRILPNSARDLLDCEFWQMAQTGPLEYEVRYVPRDTGAPGDEAGFTALFRSIYFEDAQVRYRRVEEIPLTAAGKLLEYVNEWSRPVG